MRVHRWASSEEGYWRGWWRLLRNGERERELLELHVEAGTRWRHGLIATVELGGQEEPFQLTLAAPGFYLHFGVSAPVLSRPFRRIMRPGRLGYGGRDFGIKISDGRLCILIACPEGASTRYPRWRWTRFLRGGRNMRRKMRPEPLGDSIKALDGWEFTFAPLNTLLGSRLRLSNVEQEPVSAAVPMPEGIYPCTVTLSRATWGRKRWPWGREHTTQADVEIPGGIPVPGKGENSWDCDDDATYSVWMQAASVGDALGKVAALCLSTRERYANRDWTPRGGWPEHAVAR